MNPINEDYFSLKGMNDNIIVGYQDAELTGQTFNLSINFQSTACIIENYLVSYEGNTIYFYEFDETTSGYIQPYLQIELLHNIYSINHYHNDDGEYLMCRSNSAVSVVALVISNGIMEGEIIETPPSTIVYPNPFSVDKDTQISFEFTGNSYRDTEIYEIKVFNIKGQTVYQNKGQIIDSNITWNCCTENGDHLASGIYFYQIENQDFNSSGKIVITK
jgi:hypothetical protein